MEPEGKDLWTGIGKRIMLKLFGTLDHSMKAYGIITTILTIALAIPSFSPLQMMQIFGDNFAWIEVGLVFGLVLGTYLGPVMALASSRTTCPKCGWKFSWFRTKILLTRHAELSDRSVRNYLSTYTCSNPSCGFKEENVPEVSVIRDPSSV